MEQGQTIMEILGRKITIQRKVNEDWRNLPLVYACAHVDLWGEKQWFGGVCIETDSTHAKIVFWNPYGNDSNGKWFVQRVFISEEKIKVLPAHHQTGRYAAQVRQWALEALAALV